MKKLLLFVLIGNIILIQSPSEVVLPETVPKLPVLIRIPHQDGSSGIGTGILLAESNKVFLVTATHVIFNIADTNLQALTDTNAIITVASNTFSINLQHLLVKGLIKRHTTHDVTVIQIGHSTDYTNTILEEPASGLFGEPLVLFAAERLAITFTNVLEGSETYILGYPVELMKDNPIAAAQVDFLHPLIRKGIISQKNLNTGKIILDSGVYGGNSGGPVLIAQHPSLEQSEVALSCDGIDLPEAGLSFVGRIVFISTFNYTTIETGEVLL